MSALEAEILSSFIYYPDEKESFLKQCPMECFSNDGREAVAVIESLQEKEALSINAFTQSLSESQKQKDSFLSILSTIPNPNISNLAHIFKQNYLLDKQREAGSALIKASENNALLDIDMLMPKIENAQYRNMSEWQNYYESKPSVIKFKTGIAFLDSVFDGGIECAQLVLISGDPEAGKTTLGLQILEYISKTQRVCFFSFEYPIYTYLKRRASAKHLNPQNMIIIDDGYEIYQVCAHIKALYKQGIRVFLIDSQMRLISPNGRNMEEEESLKFSTLARLCHSLGIIVFLIVQTSKGDRDNPMGSKKGGHESSITIRIEHDRPENESLREFSDNSRIVILKKNKQTGKHYKERVGFDNVNGRFYMQEAQEKNLEVIEI